MRRESEPMDCGNFELLLSAYVDDQLAPEEVWEVHGHLMRCSACASHLTQLSTTVHALRSLPRAVPVTDCWEAVAFTLRREGLVRPWWARPRPWSVGAATAGLLVALYAYSSLRPEPQYANLDAYWREHAIFTSQQEPVYSNGAPSLEAMEATYQLQGVAP